MGKIIELLKPLLGFLIIFCFVLTFSSCEEKGESRNQRADADTVIVKDTVVMEKDTINWEEKIGKESEEMEAKLERLKVKAKKKGVQAEIEVNQIIDRLNEERKEISSGNTSEKVKEKWDRFKEESEEVLDSLDKKF